MDKKLKDKVRDTLDSKIKVQIPNNLDEAVERLKKMADEEDLEEIRSGKFSPTSSAFGAGMWIRNNWGLWGDSKLQKWFSDRGIKHADDSSAIILEKFEADLQGKVFDLDERIKHYRDYWENKGQDPDEIGK